jgi:hypothetical protein
VPTALTSINKTFISTDIIYSSNDDLKFNPAEGTLGTNSSAETDCLNFQSLPAKGHENYVGVTCLNLLCVCSEMLRCVKANTPTTYALQNNMLKDVKISIFIDYGVSAPHVLLLISIPVLEETSKVIRSLKLHPVTNIKVTFVSNIPVEFSKTPEHPQCDIYNNKYLR